MWLGTNLLLYPLDTDKRTWLQDITFRLSSHSLFQDFIRKKNDELKLQIIFFNQHNCPTATICNGSLRGVVTFNRKTEMKLHSSMTFLSSLELATSCPLNKYVQAEGDRANDIRAFYKKLYQS